MTSAEIVRALREDCKTCSENSVCENGVNLAGLYCANKDAADLIERMEKEKAALLEAASPRKLCDICKHDSWCADHGCNGNLCEECGSYSNCPCSNCLTHPKWEWKEPKPEAPEVE